MLGIILMVKLKSINLRMIIYFKNKIYIKMSNYYDMTVNCSTGIDEIENNEEGDNTMPQKLRDSTIPYKTTDKAIEDAKTGVRIFVHPGNYSGVDIETKSANAFEYNIYGAGKNTVFNSVSHSGFINSSYKDLSIRDMLYICSGTESTFENVTFVGGHKMICKCFFGVNENPTNELEFQNCTFGINFQIFVVSGMYKFTFKNCTFKNKVMPIVYVDCGDVELNITYSNFSVPVVENHKGCVYIYHTSCIFKDRIWSGKECSLFKIGDEQTASGLRSQKSYYDEKQTVQIKDSDSYEENEIFKAVEVDTDEFSIIQLKPETEFVYVSGRGPLTIVLPDEKYIKNSHYIQVLNNSTIVIVDDLQYSDRIINIRYLLGRGWIFFKS